MRETYVESLIDILRPPPVPAGVTIIGGGGPGPADTDIFSIVRAQLLSLQQDINAAIPLTTDWLTKYHLQDLSARIKEAFQPK